MVACLGRANVSVERWILVLKHRGVNDAFENSAASELHAERTGATLLTKEKRWSVAYTDAASSAGLAVADTDDRSSPRRVV
jgi:hypothetical protein